MSRIFSFLQGRLSPHAVYVPADGDRHEQPDGRFCQPQHRKGALFIDGNKTDIMLLWNTIPEKSLRYMYNIFGKAS